MLFAVMAVRIIPGPNLSVIHAFISSDGEAIPPLHCQALFGRVREMNLVDREALNHRGPRGNTPLHFAALTGQLLAIDALLSSGANPALLNEDGGTYADIFELTASKITRNVKGYRAVSTPHIPAIELLRIWCLCRPNPMSKARKLLPSRVIINPDELQVKVHPIAGRTLHGSIKSTELVGPYIGQHMGSRVLIEEKTEIYVGREDSFAQHFPRSKKVSHYMLGSFDAEPWGNEVALAADGGDGYFLEVKAYRGMPSASFLEVTRDVCNRAVTVDYGESHSVARLPDYVHFSEDADRVTLEKMLTQPDLINKTDIYWCEWLLSRPAIIERWLADGTLSIDNLKTLHQFTTDAVFQPFAEFLKLLEPKHHLLAIKFFRHFINVVLNDVKPRSFPAFLGKVCRRLKVLAVSFSGGSGEGLSALLDLELQKVVGCALFIFNCPGRRTEVSLPLLSKAGIWMPEWEVEMPFALGGDNEVLEELRACEFSKTAIEKHQAWLSWVVVNPNLLGMWLQNGTLNIDELMMIYRLSSTSASFTGISHFLGLLASENIAPFTRLYRQLAGHLFDRITNSTRSLWCLNHFFTQIFELAKLCPLGQAAGISIILDLEFRVVEDSDNCGLFDPTSDCFRLVMY